MLSKAKLWGREYYKGTGASRSDSKKTELSRLRHRVSENVNFGQARKIKKEKERERIVPLHDPASSVNP